MRAKQLWFAEGCKPLFWKLGIALSGLKLGLMSLFPVSVGLPFLVRRKLGWLGLAAIVASYSAYALVIPSAAYMNTHRYLYALFLPWAIFGLAVELGQPSTPRYLPFALATISMFLFPTYALAEATRIRQELFATVRWVNDHIPPDATLLIHDAGAISEFSNRPAADMVGLKTQSSIELNDRWTWASCGRERSRALVEMVQTSGAQFVVAEGNWDHNYKLSDSLRLAGYEVRQLRRPPANEDGYFVYGIQAPRP